MCQEKRSSAALMDEMEVFVTRTAQRACGQTQKILLGLFGITQCCSTSRFDQNLL